MSLDPDACERRVYRLATLLTGDPDAAVRVIEAVAAAQPDLRRPDSARLDRLTVLRCREIAPSALDADAVPAPVAGALAGLAAQGREAWVLSRACGLPVRETARAMDCSVTATRRHLQSADSAMAGALEGGAPAAITAVREYSMSLDVPEFLRARRRRRRRIRNVVLAVLLIALAVALPVAIDRLMDVLS